MIKYLLDYIGCGARRAEVACSNFVVQSYSRLFILYLFREASYRRVDREEIDAKSAVISHISTFCRNKIAGNCGSAIEARVVSRAQLQDKCDS